MRYKVASSSFDKIPLIGNNEFYSSQRNVWNRQNETRSMDSMVRKEIGNDYSQLISVLIVEKQIDKIIHIVGIIPWYIVVNLIVSWGMCIQMGIHSNEFQ